MTSKKVLVIDDSITTLQWISLVLQQVGYTVETSKTIWVAPIFSSFKPHLAIVDVNICRNRNNDGPMIVKTLKKRNPNTKFMLFSSVEENTLKSLADNCGADGFIQKTHNHSELLQQVNKILL